MNRQPGGIVEEPVAHVHSRRRRVPAILAALAVSTAGAMVLGKSFLGDDAPPQQASVDLFQNGPIAFLGLGPPGDTDLANGELFLVDPSTGSVRNASRTAVPELMSVWSPDGRRVIVAQAWIAANSWQYRLQAMTFGSNAQPLGSCGVGCDDVSVAWSPDGTRVAMVAGGDSVRVVHISDGTDVVVCGKECGTGISDLTWSPDGRRIAFTAAEPIVPPAEPTIGIIPSFSLETSIYMADAQGGSAARLTDAGCDDEKDLCNSDSTPVWSPDGNRIAFTRQTDTAAALHLIDVRSHAVSQYASCSVREDGAPLCGPYPWRERVPTARVVIGENAIDVRLANSSEWRRVSTCSGADCYVPGQVTVSPDGRQLAFVTDRVPVQIVVMSVDDGAMREVAETGWLAYATAPCCRLDWLPMNPETSAIVNAALPHPAFEELPAAPSSGVIAFDNETEPGDDYSSEVWLIGADGGGLRQLTESPPNSASSGPSWSADGRRIFFGRFDDEGANDGVRAIAADGTGVEDLGLPPGASVSSDETAAAYERDGSVWVRDLRTGAEHRVTSAAGERVHSGPRWSPDGSSIAFTDGDSDEGDIFVADSRGGPERRITQLPGVESEPSWSPDGLSIAFRSLNNEKSDVYVVNADGTGHRRLTRFGAYSPTWSPDGAAVAVAGPEWSENPASDGGALYIVRVTDGGVFKAATSPTGYGHLSWQPIAP